MKTSVPLRPERQTTHTLPDGPQPTIPAAASETSRLATELLKCQEELTEFRQQFTRLGEEVATLTDRTERLEKEVTRLGNHWAEHVEQSTAHLAVRDQRIEEIQSRFEQHRETEQSQREALAGEVDQLTQRDQEAVRTAIALRKDLDALGAQLMDREALDEQASASHRRELDDLHKREEQLAQAIQILHERLPAEKSTRTDTIDARRLDVTIPGAPLRDLPKRRAVLAVVKHLCASGRSPEQIADAIGSRRRPFSSVDGVVDGKQFVALMAQHQESQGKRFDAKRYFCKDDELLFHEGRTYALSNQWRSQAYGTIEKLLDAFPEKDGSCSASR